MRLGTHRIRSHQSLHRAQPIHVGSRTGQGTQETGARDDHDHRPYGAGSGDPVRRTHVGRRVREHIVPADHPAAADTRRKGSSTTRMMELPPEPVTPTPKPAGCIRVPSNSTGVVRPTTCTGSTRRSEPGSGPFFRRMAPSQHRQRSYRVGSRYAGTDGRTGHRGTSGTRRRVAGAMW